MAMIHGVLGPLSPRIHLNNHPTTDINILDRVLEIAVSLHAEQESNEAKSYPIALTETYHKLCMPYMVLFCMQAIDW
eukprot:CAMPEP_0198133688 /NCGR_PEP_ID=MMETSP1442-20131203/59693_1 /TAXON_ID= /ORGANISM="Craspedostauros australis, Strain CCMP3328" /LENGTH=76 /DNA_ID=CAMNT_0043794819 /DNA_START=1109 /DNA_END=1336 /DNA_ORIENTATION=-